MEETQQNQTTIDPELLDAIVEVAVVCAMTIAATTFRIPCPPGGPDIAKAELMKLVRCEVAEGEVFLFLDRMASIRVAPLYGLFAGAWPTSAAQTATSNFLKNSAALAAANLTAVKLR